MLKVPKSQRLQFKNISIAQILNYRLPLAGVVSILHRISGFLIFLLLPIVLYILQCSFVSEDNFNYFKKIVSYGIIKFMILVLFWVYFYHFCAGIRHLIMDNHYLLDIKSARRSAAFACFFSIILTIILAFKLFGIF